MASVTPILISLQKNLLLWMLPYNAKMKELVFVVQLKLFFVTKKLQKIFLPELINKLVKNNCLVKGDSKLKKLI